MKHIAIITGASSGLGREYVRQLIGRKDIDEFWIIARRAERLEELREELSDKIRPVSLDLTSTVDLERLASMLDIESPDIRLLINAAGMGRIGTIRETGIADCETMIDLNCKAMVLVTQLCLPLMSKGAQILQISSIASFQPLPSLAVYAATKAFVTSYTKSLHHELRGEGIHVTAVCPYWIKDTEFIPVAKAMGSKLFVHTPMASKSADVVRISLRDAESNRMVSTPGFVSSAERIVAKIVPDALLMPLADLSSKL